MKVTIVSKELITPSSSTPSNLKTYELSFIDQQIPPSYVPFILYYSNNEFTTITQSKIITNLKTSLSKTLTNFYPLAGRLTKNQTAIDCNDQGVRFSVTHVDCDLMNIVKSPIIKELNQLLSVDESSYVEEQLAIQVNLFDCGGIAVGVCISHRIADACSFSSFVSHWFGLTKGTETVNRPVLDTTSLFAVPGGVYGARPHHGPTVIKNLVTKRFVFSSFAIHELKHMVKAGTTTTLNPTRVEVVTALIWKCMTNSTTWKATVAFHVVNFRRKTVPPLQDHQFGNLFQMANATADRTADVASRVGKLRGSFGKIDSEYVKSLMGENGVEIGRGNFGEIRKCMSEEGVGVFRFSSWCRFAVSEGDFGCGKPVWISSANFNSENCVILMDSRRDDGIEAWVVMNEDDMKMFEQDTELQAYNTS